MKVIVGSGVTVGCGDAVNVGSVITVGIDSLARRVGEPTEEG